MFGFSGLGPTPPSYQRFGLMFLSEIKTKTLKQVKNFVKCKIHLFREKSITNEFTILYDRLNKRQFWNDKEEQLLKKAFEVYGPNYNDI